VSGWQLEPLSPISSKVPSKMRCTYVPGVSDEMKYRADTVLVLKQHLLRVSRKWGFSRLHVFMMSSKPIFLSSS